MFVTRGIGLDPTGYSITYIIAWSDADTATIRKHASVIDQLAAQIEDGIRADAR